VLVVQWICRCLLGGGGGGGDEMDPIMGGPPSGPLGRDLGARVPVMVKCCCSWHGDNNTGGRGGNLDWIFLVLFLLLAPLA
jgi:hypothetical protein